jgi:AcrR family transcriptional regulator
MENKPYHHGDLKNALIQAGIELLAEEGSKSLTLRKVAQRVGVSHAAPYAHFIDKEALIAAIATEGFHRIYEQMSTAIQQFPDDPLRQMVEGAWNYVEFALNDPAHFKITFSGVVEREKAYPDFVSMSHSSFDLVVEIVRRCQAAGVLKPGSPDLTAMSLWSLVHGFVSLALENQFPHRISERQELKKALYFALNQITQVEIQMQS